MCDTSADVVMGDRVADNLVALAYTWPQEHLVLFRKLHQNVADNPGEAKFRKLKLSNARIGALVAAPGAFEALQALGWQSAEGGEVLELPGGADMATIAAVLQGTAQPTPPGEQISINVLRGTSKVKLDLCAAALPSTLAAAIEQHAALGRIPRRRQRLFAGYPPKLLEDFNPNYARMSLAELGLKAVKLEDVWEETVGDLRAGRASFAQLASVLQCKKTLQDNRDFLLDSARMMLKARASNMPEDEMCAARKCFTVLWPPGDPETREARVGFSTECTTLAAPVPESEGDRASSQLLITVERANLFDSAVSQVDKASSEDLHRPLDVRFQGEAAEDAGGPRREFFNEFGIAAAANEQVWCTTPAGALKPKPGADTKIMRSCGRIFGLALCQLENAAQEQNVGANATLADLLAAVREPEEEQAQQQQKLLIGLPLSRSFLRVLQGDAPTSVEELQVELNAEQAESSPDFRGSANFLNTSLQDLGLAGQLTFSAAPRDGSVVDLVPDGRHTVVTDATKHEWLRQTLRYEMVDSIQEAAGAFRAGVSEAAGVAHLVLLSAVELRDEWSGRADVSDEDVKLWEARTKVNPTRKRQAAWFFELLSDELRSKRARILKLTTGSDRWPVDSRTFSFTIEPMDGGDDSLPRAMTCGNMLQLPSYECREKLRDNLLKACEWGVSMDLV